MIFKILQYVEFKCYIAAMSGYYWLGVLSKQTLAKDNVEAVLSYRFKKTRRCSFSCLANVVANKIRPHSAFLRCYNPRAITL